MLIDLIIIGLIAGKTDLVAISNYIKENLEEFSALLNLKKAPSHDCFNDLINLINPELLEEAFEKWVQSYYKPTGLHQLSGDGTFILASKEKIRKGKQPNLINFISIETALIVANELVMGKGGAETEGFKRILKRLDLKDALITADALNCTQWIMEYIDENEGYFLFPVKNDKKALKAHIITSLAENIDSIDQFHQDLILDHGMLVDRLIYTSDEMAKLKAKGYPYLKQYGIIESTRMNFVYDNQNNKKITKVNYKYYGIISNFTCSAQKASMIKLDEWKVETFHKQKDQFLAEDHTCYKNLRGINVMAILRRVAYNYLILSDQLISNFHKESLSEKSIFLDAHKELLTMLVNGYNPDYPSLMENFHNKKAQFYHELGNSLTEEVLEPLNLCKFTDLSDF